MKTVELFIAYTWTCDECGRNNYSDGIPVPRDDLAEAMLREADVEIDELDEAELASFEEALESECCVRPDQVKCKHCNTEFVVAKDSRPGNQDGS